MKRRSIELSLAILMTATCLGVTGCTGIIQPSIGESGIASTADAENPEGAGETPSEGGAEAPEGAGEMPSEGEAGAPEGAGEMPSEGGAEAPEGAGETPSEGGAETPEGAGEASSAEGAPEGEGGDAAGASEGMGGPGQQENEPKPEMTGDVQVRFATSTEIANGLGQKKTLTATVELYDKENAEGYNALIDLKLDESETFTQCTWSEQNGEYILKLDEFTNYESKELDGVCTMVGVRYAFGMDGKGTIDIPLESKGTEKPQETSPETKTVEESTEGM